jgi:hypothetical protein
VARRRLCRLIGRSRLCIDPPADADDGILRSVDCFRAIVRRADQATMALVSTIKSTATGKATRAIAAARTVVRQGRTATAPKVTGNAASASKSRPISSQPTAR